MTPFTTEALNLLTARPCLYKKKDEPRTSKRSSKTLVYSNLKRPSIYIKTCKSRVGCQRVNILVVHIYSIPTISKISPNNRVIILQ